MWKHKNETRPLCKWTEHDWKPGHYAVLGDAVRRVYHCPKCGRVRLKVLPRE